MLERPDELEKLDLRVQWGPYDIHVMRFHYVRFQPGHTISFHKHAEYEFHFIPRGKGLVSFGEEPFALKSGQYYLTGPEVMHYQESDLHEPMEELCLHVDITDRFDAQPEASLPAPEDWEWQEARSCIRKLSQLPLSPTQDLHNAMGCFLQAYEACRANYAGSYTTIKQNVIQILLRAVRGYETVNEEKKLPTKDMKLYRYHLALEFMQANYGGALSLEEVAEKLRCSSRQLQRLFKELHGGSSFSQILEDIRLTHVCKSLRESAQSIEQIAKNAGFSSGNYLHAVFRKRYGMTPSEYRSNH
nr:AraC family transcriptional regulator [Paenibacillus sp. HB172176]